jgi:hypothetical protein
VEAKPRMERSSQFVIDGLEVPKFPEAAELPSLTNRQSRSDRCFVAARLENLELNGNCCWEKFCKQLGCNNLP